MTIRVTVSSDCKEITFMRNAINEADATSASMLAGNTVLTRALRFSLAGYAVIFTRYARASERADVRLQCADLGMLPNVPYATSPQFKATASSASRSEVMWLGEAQIICLLCGVQSLCRVLNHWPDHRLRCAHCGWKHPRTEDVVLVDELVKTLFQTKRCHHRTRLHYEANAYITNPKTWAAISVVAERMAESPALSPDEIQDILAQHDVGPIEYVCERLETVQTLPIT